MPTDIDWPDESEVSKEAIDLIDKLLQVNASMRLGFQGASEVKVMKTWTCEQAPSITDKSRSQEHPFFAGIDWNKVLKMKMKAIFLPRQSHEEDISYFDPRNQDFPSNGGVYRMRDLPLRASVTWMCVCSR